MNLASNTMHRPPGAYGLKGIAAVLDFKRDPFSTIVKLRADYGDLCLLQIGRKRLIFCFHPDLVEHVLSDSGKNYSRSEKIFPWFRAIMGEGVFTSSSEDHRYYREALLSIISAETIEDMSEISVVETDRLLARWEEGDRLNIVERMEVLTFRILIRLLLGADLDEGAEENLIRDFRIVFDYPYERMLDWIPLPMAVPTPGWSRFNRALKNVDSFLRGAIMRVGTGTGSDFSSARRIVNKLAESGKTDAELRFVRDQLMSLLFTAYSATTTLLAWSFYLLDGHPEIENELRDAPTVKNKTSVFAGLVLKESLRLYPPVWVMGRQAVSSDRLFGYAINPGDALFVSPYVTHRHPEFWEDPSEFKPSRFLPESAASRHRFSFFPFSGGAMQCIGGSFAMTQANIILSRVIGRWSLKTIPGQDLKPAFGFKLRPKDGLWVKPVRI